MISIIVCSVRPELLDLLRQNIRLTIGTPYEILAYDNRGSNMGLCEVYNGVAKRAAFSYLCFLHEDIVIETENWGLKIVKDFEANGKLGVIGVAGSSYKSKTFSGWYTGMPENDVYRIVHQTSGVNHTLQNPTTVSDKLNDVVCVDGVFIACRKSVWEQIRFNQDLLPGFHFYDIDFSLRASQFCEVAVTLQILIVHITLGGDYGDPWVQAAILFHSKTDQPLPSGRATCAVSAPEIYVARQWLDRLKGENISLKNRFQWIGSQKLFLVPALWYSCIKFLTYRPFGLKHVHKRIKKNH